MANRSDDPLFAAFAARSRRATGLITARISDAAAHAHDGRQADAEARLTELHQSLTGTRPDGIIPEARAAFARAAVLHHARTLSADVMRTDSLSPSEAADIVRPPFHHGRDLHRELGGMLDEARSHLTATGAAFDRSDSATVNLRSQAFFTWETTHRDRLVQWATAALTDSQMAIHEGVRLTMIRPELRK